MATIGFKASDQKLMDDFDNFNFDDFNFDVPEPKDDRHPIVKALAPIGRGAKNYITDASSIEKFVKAAMPRGYGQAYDLAQEARSEVKQLYNSVGEEIKPVKESAKTLMRKALPALDGKIPKGLKEKLEAFSKEEQQWQARQGDRREEQLGDLLKSIFEQKATDQVAQRNELNEREKVRQGFEQIRHRDQISQLDAIRLAVESQAQYQNKIGYSVQKKQLELSYRTFWAMADLNKEQKRSNAEFLSELKAVTRNTSLPDMAKISLMKDYKSIIRNKFLENAREGMFGGAQDYFRKFSRNIKDQVVGRVRDYAGMAGTMSAGAEGMAGMMEGMGDMPGFNARDEMIAGLMHLPMDWLAEKAGRKANAILAKNKKLRRGGSRASYMVNTVGDRIHEQLTDPTKGWGSLEGLRELLASAAPSSVPDSKMEVDSLDRAHEPRPFSRGNAKSLDEVIPGLLARIHREIKILRTGDESTPLVTYDFAKNKFSTEKQMGSDLRKRIAGGNTDRANHFANNIINRIDRGKKLTPEQRERARQHLIERAVMGESIDITKSHLGSHWGGGQDGQAIADSFSRYLRSTDGKLGNNDQAYKRQIELMQQHRGIVGGIGDPRVLLQQMVNSGQLETLKNIGIIDENNNLDRKAYSQWLMHAEEADLSSPASTTSGGGKSFRRTPGSRRRAAPSAGMSDFIPRTSSKGAMGGGAAHELRSLNESLSNSTVEKNVQTIADLLASLDSKYAHAAEVNYLTLQAMLDQLIAIASTSGGMGGSGGQGPLDLLTKGKRAYTSLWEHVKGSSREGLDRIKAHGKSMAARGMQLWDKYSPGAKRRVGDILGAGRDKLKDMHGRLRDYYGDVVVSGESFPRLRANLLKAGEYRDRLTGRVLTSLEDITGDVVDSSGNLVITLDEFYNSYVTGTINKRVRELFTNVTSKLADWKSRLQVFIPSTIRDLKSKALGALNRVKEMLPPYDVYVKNDMSKPLLFANMFRYEMYTSAKTGNALKHPRDIDGPVLDDKGNMVLTEDHIKVGLCDVVGDPITSARIPIKIMRKAKAAWEMMRDAAVGIFGALKGGLGNVNEYFKNFFTPFADIITNSKKTVTLLEAIRDILDDRLPKRKKVRGDVDGDGIREGSIEDIHRKRDQAMALTHDKAAGRDPNADIKAGQGMIGKLLGALFGKKKAEEDEEGHHHGGSLLDDVADVADIYDDLKGGRGARGSAERRAAAKARLKRMRGAKPGFLRRGVGALGKLGKGALGRLGKWGLFNTDLVRGVGKVAGGIGSPLLRGAGKVAGGLGSLAVGAGRGLMGQSKLARLARWGMFNTDLVRGGAKGLGWAAKGLGAAAKLAPRALGLAGTAYSAYSAYDNIKQGNYGAAALDAGLGLGGMALTGGGLAGLASMGGAAMGGLGAVLASPFLLPALGVAAVGAAGYALYKYSQKTKPTNLSKLRLAQYGIAEDDTDARDKIFQLEQMLEDHMTIREDGNMMLDEKGVKLEEIADLFDIHREKDMQLFNMWYKRRFVPVYRKWLTEMRKFDKGAKIAKIESVIPGKSKLSVASSAVSSCMDAYSHMVGWSNARPELAVDANGVQAVLDSMRVDLAKDAEKDGGPKATAVAKDGVSSTTEASALAAKALTDKAHYQVKDQKGNVLDAASMNVGELTEKIKKGSLTVSVAVTLPASLVHNDKTHLDALASIRYKAYGLTHLSADKVRMLGAMELFIGDHITDDPDSPKLNISTEVVMKAAGEVFGVPNMTGEHATRWKTWFNGRFLPVFLMWAGTIRKKTGKTKLQEASDAFSIEDQLSLARAIIGATGVNADGSKVPVWQILTNPWQDDYELNSDPDSTAGNLEAIRLLADKVKLGQVSASQLPNKRKEPVVWYKPWTWGNAINEKVGGKSPNGKQGAGVNATGDSITGATGSKGAAALSGMGDPVSFSGGGGGNYTELPASSGNGWSANRALILAAAKMAGVDPKALIATIAIESGFNPNAAPKNPNLPSSAKGFGQHLDSSWLEDLQRDGRKFGIPNGTSQFDPRASALMTAMRLKYNAQALQKALGRQPTVTDLYLAHLMGTGGATKFLKAPQDAIGAEEAPTAAKQHPTYFYEGSRALTVKEVYAKFAAKVAKRPAEFGVTDTDMKSVGSVGSGATPPPASGGGAPPPAAPAKAGAASAGPAPRGSGGAPGKATSANTPSAGSPRLNAPVTMDKGHAATMGTGPAIVKSKDAKYELILQREESEDDGTYGTLRLPDGTTLNTLELPWRNNESKISCIPPGSYPCKKRPSAAFGREMYEVGQVQGRSGVLIHAGNAAGSADKGMKADSQGCILLGMDRGRQGNQKVITASKAAMQLFNEKMQDMPFTLIIRPGKGGLGTGDSKANVSFDPVRGPANTGAQPGAGNGMPAVRKQSSAAGGGYADSVATGSDLPRYNTTSTGLNTGGPTRADMRGRDAAMSDTIGPKLDNVANTLSKIADSSDQGVGVLRQILAVMKGKGDGDKPPSVSANKVRPETDTSVPVPQRRNF
ncbi:hypothetical protein [Ralstonia phage RP12]|uniref:DUF5675 domain-containing protein n=1 Tax=Ralstonia phage RP12 TaxID=1923889 RepID=A0A1L7N0M8_9CAUD|nr:tail fiber protein [Ralstonia phage RP12]BAW19017.1 hypothetical protein [Ralstonia phage RP12]